MEQNAVITQTQVEQGDTKELPIEILMDALKYLDRVRGSKEHLIKHEDVLPLLCKKMGWS